MNADELEDFRIACDMWVADPNGAAAAYRLADLSKEILVDLYHYREALEQAAKRFDYIAGHGPDDCADCGDDDEPFWPHVCANSMISTAKRASYNARKALDR